MLGLLKKLFGGKPAEATAEAPYKVEAPVVDLADIAIAQSPAPVAETPAPVAETKPALKKKPAPKKAQAPKTPGAPKKGGRKPKSKPQA